MLLQSAERCELYDVTVEKCGCEPFRTLLEPEVAQRNLSEHEKSQFSCVTSRPLHGVEKRHEWVAAKEPSSPELGNLLHSPGYLQGLEPEAASVPVLYGSGTGCRPSARATSFSR